MGEGRLDHIRTIIFTALGIDSLLYVFSVRSLRHSIFTKNIFSNLYLVGAVIIAFFILISAVYVPFLQTIFKTVSLNGREWLVILSLGLIKITAIEIVKHYFIVKRKSNYKKQPPISKNKEMITLNV